jgi:hypothetical protein
MKSKSAGLFCRNDAALHVGSLRFQQKKPIKHYQSIGASVMESRLFNIGQGKDRMSALPDDLLLEILERLSLHEAVRAGAVSTRWRHLPHQLSRVDLDVDNFQGTTLLETMDAFTGAVRSLLPAECKCDCKSMRAVKTLCLQFYMSAPHLSSIGHAVEDTVSRGQTEHLEFGVIPPSSDLTDAGRTELGRQFMSFSRACPIAFQWLTDLSLTSLEFGASDLPSLMGACSKLTHLSLSSCTLVGNSVLKIDLPSSTIQELDLSCIRCIRIELVSLPKLRQLMCDSWHYSNNPPLHFGYVPELRKVALSCHAGAWQAPFALSDCFSMNASYMSTLHLNFGWQMVIQLLHPHEFSMHPHIDDIFLSTNLVHVFFVADMDSARTSQAAHCYIP